jgi:hypothetical protein
MKPVFNQGASMFVLFMQGHQAASRLALTTEDSLELEPTALAQR